MKASFPEIAVAGHICIDIIPGPPPSGVTAIPGPGEITAAGPATISTGGVVSNTGLALHRLGVPTRLMGKVGDDLLGRLLLDILRAHAPHLAEGMTVAPGEPTSYTVVITPPEGDRGFLHCPGVNDTFHADDVDFTQLNGAALFHFGYPPLMRRMFQDGGAETEALFRRAKELGLTTALDMARPDPASEAGRVDWRAFLERVLPHVDLFLPSLDETKVFLGAAAEPAKSPHVYEALGDELLSFGAAAVVLKLGDRGLYMRSTADKGRWAKAGRAAPRDTAAWTDRSLYAPCFAVDVAGTTGAGDVTGAGFLAAFVQGLPPEETLVAATAVGAHGVERPDATSGVPSWEAVQARIQAGWARLPTELALDGWRRDESTGVYASPGDGRGR